MSANVEAMIRAGIDAFRAGNKTDARALLERAIELDEYNEMAWLWLAAVVETPEEQRTCLENVIVINPNSERARQGLKSLGIDPDAQRSALAPQDDVAAFNYDSADDLFGDADFSAPAASSGPADAPVGEDYDNWVGGLGLGKKSAPAQPEPFESGASPFGEFDFGANPEEIFKDDELFDTSVRSVSNYIATSIEDSGPQRPVSGSYRGHDEEKSLFADLDSQPEQTPLGGIKQDPFEALLTADDLEGDFGGLFDEEPAAKGGQQDSTNAIFAKIPAEIAAADRLPGMDEAAPRGGLIVLGLLGLLNVGALVFFVSALLS